MLQKKGDLSMSTIVMAVIAVLILIILASIIMRNLGDFSRGASDCRSIDGVCSYEQCRERMDQFTRQHPTARCIDAGRVVEGQYCCVVGG